MADRKQTPDILGDILSDALASPGDTPTPVEATQAGPAVAAAPARRPGPVRPTVRRPRQPVAGEAGEATAPPAEAIDQQIPTPKTARRWEYLIISFQEHNGWRPRFINGEELEDWTRLPPIHDYANLLGELGWELAGAAGGGALYGNGDARQLCFKREKPAA